MTTVRRVTVVAAALAVLTTGCGGSESGSQAPTTMRLHSADVERATARATPAATTAARGMQTFAYDLLAKHPDVLDGPNRVVSSASIGAAFAMLRAGAEGETAEQIDAVLGFPDSGLGPAYNFLTHQWRSEGKDAPELSVANSLFVQHGFPLKPGFLDALARDFGAGVRAVDFVSGDAARVINAWVRDQTRDRIDKLFNELDPRTRLVLANAIYLKASWVHQFDSEQTRDDAFRRASGGSVQVPFMHQTAQVGYADGDGWSAVRLPYVGGELSMWVLLPDGTGDPVKLLDPTVLARAAARAEPARVELSLPKWDFQSDVPLTDALPAMGMPRAFSTGAEFGGVSTKPLTIDQVRHRADISVDEEGTEAAAVTGIGMRVEALPADQATFDADHPFAFVVMHDATGSPLFEGVVGDPSQTQ